MATKHTTIRLDSGIYEKLLEIAKNQNISVNEVISNACHVYTMGPTGTCYNCHKENLPTAKYCQNCGLPLDQGLLVNTVNETLKKYEDSLNTIVELRQELMTCRANQLKLLEDNNKMSVKCGGLAEKNNFLKYELYKLGYKSDIEE